MIPKVIHYCWFGRNQLPDTAKEYIEGWKRICPDYEVKEWNEDNFDVNCCDYVREAYLKKKWAFVSDYARFWILYNFGGVYLDTDVEMVKNIDSLLEKGDFMAIEDSPGYNIAPGLCLASKAGNHIYKKILDFYNALSFVDENGCLNQITVCEHITKLFEGYGYERKNKLQYIQGIYIYPTEYFCPKNVLTGKLVITENTRTIHHYDASWLNLIEKFYRKIENRAAGKGKIIFKIVRVFTFPIRVYNKIYILGLNGTIRFIKRGLRHEHKNNK